MFGTHFASLITQPPGGTSSGYKFCVHLLFVSVLLAGHTATVVAGESVATEVTPSGWVPADRLHDSTNQNRTLHEKSARSRHELKPVTLPEGILILTEPEESWHLLGENVLVHYQIINGSDEPFNIEVGGDYRGSDRSLRNQLKAYDDKGNQLTDPHERRRVYSTGGIGSRPTLEPGETFTITMVLARHAEVTQPGTYKLRLMHDLGLGGLHPTPDDDPRWAETIVHFSRPTESQARELIERYAVMPSNRGTVGEPRKPFPDFVSMRQDAYLPLLRERYLATGSNELLGGVTGNYSAAADAVLIEILNHALDYQDHRDNEPLTDIEQKIANQARWLTKEIRLRVSEIRSPRYLTGPLNPDQSKELRQVLARQIPDTPDGSWRRLAERLIDVNDPDSLLSASCIYRAIGGPDDYPAIIDTLNRIALTEPEDRKQRVRVIQSLVTTAEVLRHRGARIETEPMKSGDIAIYLSVSSWDSEFQPPEHTERLTRICLGRGHPFLLPTLLAARPPLPDAFHAQLIDILESQNAELHRPTLTLIQRIAATGDDRHAEALLEYVATHQNADRINQAVIALKQMGEPASTLLKIMAKRLDDPGVSREMIPILYYNAFTHHGSLIRSDVQIEPAQRTGLREFWLAWIDANAARLDRGDRAAIATPAVPEALIYPGDRFRMTNQTDGEQPEVWPKRKP